MVTSCPSTCLVICVSVSLSLNPNSPFLRIPKPSLTGLRLRLPEAFRGSSEGPPADKAGAKGQTGCTAKPPAASGPAATYVMCATFSGSHLLVPSWSMLEWSLWLCVCVATRISSVAMWIVHAQQRFSEQAEMKRIHTHTHTAGVCLFVFTVSGTYEAFTVIQAVRVQNMMSSWKSSKCKKKKRKKCLCVLWVLEMATSVHSYTLGPIV